jgi:hypothetical protein
MGQTASSSLVWIASDLTIRDPDAGPHYHVVDRVVGVHSANIERIAAMMRVRMPVERS